MRMGMVKNGDGEGVVEGGWLKNEEGKGVVEE